MFQRPADGSPQIVIVPGLGQVAVNQTRVEGFDERAHIGVTGQQNFDHLRADGDGFHHQLDASHRRHALIRN